MRRIVGIAALIIGGWPSPSLALAESPEAAELRARLANPSTSLEERSRRAIEGTAILDQLAQQSTNAPARRARWSEAVGVLDEFNAANPVIESAPLLRFQAGVYRWAEGRSLLDQSELSPGDAVLRAEATRSLDDSVRRFRSIAVKPGEVNGVFGQNVRFRLAQAIADRSKLEPEGDPARNASEREAIGLLDATLTTPGLRSFARLLRAELSNRLGLFGQSQMELEQSEKSNPPPPAAAILETRVAALSGRRQYDEARKAIDDAKVGANLKALLRLRVVLARRREKAPGAERKGVDEEAFRAAEGFRGSGQPEARRGLMELARTIDEPAEPSSPDFWDLLAEGQLRLGDPVRAGRLVGKGADRAEAVGSPEKAASLRYKAGAYLFEAEKFAEADGQLAMVGGSKAAPRDLKARAGMLRALAKGRGVATRQDGASKDAYLALLESQVRDYPNEPSSGEARWLLGQVRSAAGRSEEAVDLWSGIVHGHPRWLEANILVADRLRQAVEAQRINRDSSAIAAKMELARKSLRKALDQSSEGPEGVALSTQLVRLELIPESGRPPIAVETCDRLLRGAARPEEHRVARTLRMVGLAQAGRAFDAEQVAKAEAKLDDFPVLLEALRLLDRSASEAEADLSRRRFGLIARVLTLRMIDQFESLPAGIKDEVRLHHARALLFSGDPSGAKKEIAAWGGPTGPVDGELLRELADLYLRLDAFALAIDAERYRASRLEPGSLPWFESRYAMSLAYYRSDKLKDARQIIDATAILHADLGGGELRMKFDRLRQKLGND